MFLSIGSLVVVILIATAYLIESRKKFARYEAELEKKEEAIHILHDEIFVADALTDFITKLKDISEKHKLGSVNLHFCTADLEDIKKTVLDPNPFSIAAGHAYSAVLKDENALEDLRKLRASFSN